MHEMKTPHCSSFLKGIRLHEAEASGAFFQNNDALVEWVNNQPLGLPVTCLGDGHDGVWNIISEIAPKGERREIQGLAII